MTARIAFRLDWLLPLPNKTNSRHWSHRHELSKSLAWQVRASILGSLPEKPIEQARVTVIRHGIQEPDCDAMVPSCKLLLDILQPSSKRHPRGLGIIANDKATSCELVTRFVRVRRRTDQHTCVIVEAA